MEVLVKSIGADGLPYIIDTKKQSWIRDPNRINSSVFYLDPVWTETGKKTIRDESIDLSIAWIGVTGRLIEAITVYYLRDGNILWKNMIEVIVQRLMKLCIDRGDYCYFPKGSIAPNARLDQEAEMPKRRWASDFGWMIAGLTRYYNVSGYKPAIELAGKLVNFLRDHGDYFDEEGRFLADPVFAEVGERHYSESDLMIEREEKRRIGGHFHRHTYDLLAFLEYALATDDRGLIAFVRKGYEFAKTKGSPLVGFFPEIIAPNYPTSETCEVADMIAIATKLSKSGFGDYWDDVDRWVRNQFAESQMRRYSWVYRINRPETITPVAYNETSDRVAERNMGHSPVGPAQMTGL